MQKEKHKCEIKNVAIYQTKNKSVHTVQTVKGTESSLMGHTFGMRKIETWLMSWGFRWFKYMRIVGGCPDAASVSFSNSGGDLALPGTGGMAWFSIPIALGGGTTPIIEPTGVPALGEACCCCCCWRTLSRSCCSTSLAARSVKTLIT